MMLPPRPDLYMCGRQALVVRKAPSRWIASIFFQSAKRELLERVHDLDAGVADQDVDAAERRDDRRDAVVDRPSRRSRPSPRRSPRRRPRGSRAAAASAASWLRSAIATLAPSRAKRIAISLPMPLAAPVTMADLSFELHVVLLTGVEVVVDDGAQVQGEVRHDVDGGKHFQHRQRSDRRERVMEQLQRRRTLHAPWTVTSPHW